MAVSRRQHNTAVGDGNVSVTLGSAVDEGNLLIAVLMCRGDVSNDPTPSVPSGWTLAFTRNTQIGNASFRRGFAVAYRVADGTEGTGIGPFNYGATAFNTVRVGVSEMTGADDWTLVDAASNDNGTTSNGTSIATGTTGSVPADVLVFGVMGARKNAASVTTTGWTNSLADIVNQQGSGTTGRAISTAWVEDDSAGAKSSTATVSGDNTGLSAGIVVFSLDAEPPGQVDVTLTGTLPALAGSFTVDVDAETPPALTNVREFGTGDQLHLASGGQSGMTHGTMAMLVQVAVTDDMMLGVLTGHSSGASLLFGPFAQSNTLRFHSSGSGDSNSGITRPTGVWMLAVMRKPSGSAAPRWSMYNIDTETWTHDAGGTQNNWPSMGADGTMRAAIGTSTFPLRGLVAVQACWSNALPWAADSGGDAAIEAAGLEDALQAWVDASPTGLWVFNQAAVTDDVLDLVGDAHQTSRTGTTVVDDDPPPGFDFNLSDAEAVEVELAGVLPALAGSFAVDVETPVVTVALDGVLPPLGRARPGWAELDGNDGVNLTAHGAALDIRSTPLAVYAEARTSSVHTGFVYSHGKDGNPTEYGLVFQTTEGGRTRGFYYDDTATSRNLQILGLEDGQWHRILFTVDGSGNAELWVDGTLAASAEFPNTNLIDNNNNTSIGYDATDSGFFFSGDIRHVAVWAADVSTDAEDLTAGVITPADLPSGRRGYWPLSSGPQDMSGNGRHGTEVGDPTFTGEPGAEFHITSTVTTELDGSLPPLAGSFAVQVGTSVAVHLDGALPALEGELAAAVEVTAELDGQLPALAGSFAVDVSEPAEPVDVTLAGTLPALGGAFTVAVGEVPIGIRIGTADGPGTIAEPTPEGPALIGTTAGPALIGTAAGPALVGAVTAAGQHPAPTPEGPASQTDPQPVALGTVGDVHGPAL